MGRALTASVWLCLGKAGCAQCAQYPHCLSCSWIAQDTRELRMPPAGEGGSTGGVGPDVEGPQVGAEEGKIADTSLVLNGDVSQQTAEIPAAVTADVVTAAETVTAKEKQPEESVAENKKDAVIETPVVNEEVSVEPPVNETTVKSPEVVETVAETPKVTETEVKPPPVVAKTVDEAPKVAETVPEIPVVVEKIPEVPKMAEAPVVAEVVAETTKADETPTVAETNGEAPKEAETPVVAEPVPEKQKAAEIPAMAEAPDTAETPI